MPADPGPRATPPLLKDLNERTVLETLRTDAPISRAEISRRVGISKPTVSLALQSLVAAGLVRESEHDPAGPSFGAVFFEPIPDAASDPAKTGHDVDLPSGSRRTRHLSPRRPDPAATRDRSTPGVSVSYRSPQAAPRCRSDRPQSTRSAPIALPAPA